MRADRASQEACHENGTEGRRTRNGINDCAHKHDKAQRERQVCGKSRRFHFASHHVRLKNRDGRINEQDEHNDGAGYAPSPLGNRSVGRSHHSTSSCASQFFTSRK